jgi:putative transposase
MTYEVNVEENTQCWEVYPEDVFDRPREMARVVQEELKNRMRMAMKQVLESMLEADADQQIGAIRYERGVESRKDFRNGYRHRWVSMTQGTVQLRVPRARRIRLGFRVFAAYRRRWKELDGLLLEAYIGGMSCRAVGQRLARLLGCAWSGTTIAALAKELETTLESLRHSPLQDDYEALVIDGMYVRLRQCGQRKRPVVAILGVRANGTVDLLALKVCQSENSPEVEGMLRNLKDRGLRGTHLKLVTLDGDKGLESAVRMVYGHVRIQECVFHQINRLHQNAQDKLQGRKMMQEAARAFSLPQARQQRQALRRFCGRWTNREPHAMACFQRRLDRCFEAHQLPMTIRSKVTTTSLCEGLFKQLRARTNRVGAFESPLSIERFLLAVIYQKQWINIPGRLPTAPLLRLHSPHYS